MASATLKKGEEEGSTSVWDFLGYIPSGDTIPEETWRARHRNILILLFAHVPFLFALGIYSGTETAVTGATIPEIPLWRIFAQLGVLGGIGVLATWSGFSRRTRTALSSVGIVVASTTLVFFSGGYIEAHFHFFVAIVVLALYEDWLPFALGIGVVGISHAVFGMIEASRVYNHTAAIENPFVWGLIHAIFVTAGAIALTAQWYSTERSRERVQQQLEEVEAKREEVDDLEERKAEIQQAKAEAEEAQAEARAKQQEVERLNEHLESKADAYSAAMTRAADGDLTVRLDSESESEAMVQIGEAFNEMMDETESTVREIQSFAQRVATTSEETDTGMSEVKRASEDVSESIQEIAGGTDEQREMLETVTDEVTDLSATIEEVAASADTVAESSSETTTVAEEGEATAQQAIDNVAEVKQALDSTVDNIRTLDEGMDEIGDIVGLISSITEQTNMLALNANIEAARAGEGDASDSGDGFAVVADEVKQLADETQNAASEIEQLIEKTQAQTTTTVEEAQKAATQMEQSVSAVQKVTDAFETVRRNAADADSGVQEISNAADDQAASSEEVASMIGELSDIGEEIAEESASVSAAAEEQASSVTQISGNVTSLSEQAERLQEFLSDFIVSDGETKPQATGASGD